MLKGQQLKGHVYTEYTHTEIKLAMMFQETQREQKNIRVTNTHY